MPSLNSEVISEGPQSFAMVYIPLFKMGFMEVNFSISVFPTDYEFLQGGSYNFTIFENPNPSIINVYRIDSINEMCPPWFRERSVS